MLSRSSLYYFNDFTVHATFLSNAVSLFFCTYLKLLLPDKLHNVKSILKLAAALSHKQASNKDKAMWE